MEYQKAKYEQIMCCPECGHSENNDESGMPDQWDFSKKLDSKGTEYHECSCGCKFVE